MKLKQIPFTIVSRERLATLMADHKYMNTYRNKWMELLVENKKLTEELNLSRELERIARRKLIEHINKEDK